MTLKFTVPGQPVGKARPRVVRNNGFTRTYTPEKTIIYENFIKLQYAMQCHGAMFPDGTQLCISIDAYYPIPKSASNKKHIAMVQSTIRPTKKPDADNIAKSICDALNGIAYKDDSQIVSLTINKWYSDQPEVDVEITDCQTHENAF